MKVSDYIQQKFQTFGIQLSEADLLDIVEDAGLENGDIERDASNKVRVSVAIAKFIPSLLLRAQSRSVSENGHSKSQSWDIQAIKDFYSFQCKKHGLKDELSNKPKCTFIC